MKKLNQLEFIDQYCKKSDITPDDLLEFETYALPCNCGEGSCGGWAMVGGKRGIKTHVELYL